RRLTAENGSATRRVPRSRRDKRPHDGNSKDSRLSPMLLAWSGLRPEKRFPRRFDEGGILLEERHSNDSRPRLNRQPNIKKGVLMSLDVAAFTVASGPNRFSLRLDREELQPFAIQRDLEVVQLVPAD